MHRFYLPPEKCTGEILSLAPEDSHHAARVLRLQVGNELVVLNGEGGEIHGHIESMGRHEVTLRVDRRRQHPAPLVEVVLVQAVAKAQAMDGIIHRAVELGCSAIFPLIADRSVSRPSDANGRRDKWQSMAVEAAKQSGNPWLTQILPISTLTGCLATVNSDDVLLIASLPDPPEPLKTVLKEWWHRPVSSNRRLLLAIGPEGDFSPAEYEAFRGKGARAITLGSLVLRVETAAIAALAILQHELANAA